MSQWFQLKNGYTASVSRQRRKHGCDQPPRFIVLAPMPPGKFLRPTLCAGDFVDGRCVIDHGVIGEELRAQLEVECAKVLGGVS
jgi:hypothetical protein